MYDENGNASSNGVVPALAVASNGSSSNSPSSGGVNMRFRVDPASPSSTDASGAYYCWAAQNGFGGQNGYVAGNYSYQMNQRAWMNQLMHFKDPRWLQVEVCREYQRGQCTRNEQQCKFAHPPPHVEILNGKVTTCFDSIRDRCNRGISACKFLHPPQHLKDQVLINGRHSYAMKKVLQAQIAQISQPQGFYGAPVAQNLSAINSFTTAMPPTATPVIPAGMNGMNPYSPCAWNPAALYPNVMITTLPDGYGTVPSLLPATAPVPGSMLSTAEQHGQQKFTNIRMDRTEGVQNMPNRRAVTEKIGVPVFQPVVSAINGGTTTVQCQPFFPAFSPFPASYIPMTYPGHAPSIPRL